VPKLTIERLDLAGKRVFVRADLNVPLDRDAITDDTRLRAVVPTIQYALKGGAAVVLASHLGRPKGKVAPEYSLRPVAARLEALLGQAVELAPDCVGPETLARAHRVAPSPPTTRAPARRAARACSGPRPPRCARRSPPPAER